jgi:ZIP family zinc transporter
MSKGKEIPIWFPAAADFMVGGVFLRMMDRILPHLHLSFPQEEAEGMKTTWKRSTLLVLAITLHNIPEGLAVGVAFGAVRAGFPSATLLGAIALLSVLGFKISRKDLLSRCLFDERECLD